MFTEDDSLREIIPKNDHLDQLDNCQNWKTSADKLSTVNIFLTCNLENGNVIE